MSIQKFYQTAATNDFARLFQFRVSDWQIDGTALFSGAPDALYYIETANLPGKQINNVQVPYMGLNFNVPGTISFPNSAGWQVNFRCDSNYVIREVLENELTRIFSVSNSSGDYTLPFTTSVLTLDLLGKSAGADNLPASIRQYKLHGVYIVGLQDTQYDIKDTGQIASIQATIAYQYWTSSSTSARNAIARGNTGTGSSLFSSTAPTAAGAAAGG
jgi:hypothetical protein